MFVNIKNDNKQIASYQPVVQYSRYFKQEDKNNYEDNEIG